MTETIVNLNLNVDPTKTTAAEAVAYTAEVIAGLTSTLSSTTVTAAGAPGHIVGIDKQLGRLTDHAPMYATRLKQVHTELVTLGYVPKLPKSEKGQKLPSYISYLDPATGKNLGNLNSKTFNVMRGDLRDELAKHPLFEANNRYAHCELLSDDAVKAVLKVAADQKK